jgi:3'-phosphoadenosine 5'-phosphosulfate sulfotransferase (PAPS reductase)/FAD synthetase
LEYRADPPQFEVVSHNSASRNGEPFEALCLKRHGVPNQLARFCTIELKLRTAKRFLMTLGWQEWTAAVGIRADEPNRFRPENDKGKDRWFIWQPLVKAGVSKRDVMAFWKQQPFDLRLENVNGSTPYGNCDGCFLKSERTRAALAREHPERFAWWADLERRMSEVRALRGNAGPATFIAHQTYDELASFVDRQGDWIFDTEGALCQADGGECTG